MPFPAGKAFGALVSHLGFVWDHSRKVRRIAADWHNSELSAKSFVVEHGHADDAAMPYPDHDHDHDHDPRA